MVKEGESPIITATRIRQRLVRAAKTETPTEVELSHQEGAFIIGFPTDVLKKHFSLLIETSIEGINIVQGTTRETALAAIQAWKEDRDFRQQFAETTYPLLYAFTQAAIKGVGQNLMEHRHGLILDALGEFEEYSVFQNLRAFVSGGGNLTEDDQMRISGILQDLWETMSDEIKNSERLSGRTPKNVFQ